MRISDWSSDVCSSDLAEHATKIKRRLFAAVLNTERFHATMVWHPYHTAGNGRAAPINACLLEDDHTHALIRCDNSCSKTRRAGPENHDICLLVPLIGCWQNDGHAQATRSEEHTSELQSLMRISYAVFCLKKKKKINKEKKQT